MFSQELASAACHLQYGVDVERSHALLEETKLKFDYILDALEFGSQNLAIEGAETRRKTLAKIHDLRATWTPVYTAVIALPKDAGNQEALKLIKAENETVLAKASVLISELASQYADPLELLQSDVILLDFTAREEMQTQKMAKIACEIWAGNKGEDRTKLLTKTMGTYEATLNALLNGMPEVGILPAPTPEIKASLEEAHTRWTVIKGELETVMAQAEVTEETKSLLYAHLTEEMYRLEALEKKYVVFSKHEQN